MKIFNEVLVCALAVAWTSGAMAATPSVNGAMTEGESSIIDAQGNKWDIVSGVIEKNGVRVGNNYNVDLLLEFDQSFYQRNTSSDWYRWSGATWTPTGDPRVVSSSGTQIGTGTSAVVDSAHNVWTLATNEIAYMNGVRADSNYNTVALVYADGIVYCENSSDEWYSWKGSSWERAVGDPVSVAGKGTSVSGASIGVGSASLVDNSGNVWTLKSNEYAYENGARADGNYNTIQVLYYNKTIYSENTSSEWYSWSGSKWVKVTGNPESGTSSTASAPVSSDPRGPNLVQYASYTSPVCPASEPSCTPGFVGNSSVSFTKATTKGDAIWVAATVSDYGGVHAISVTDSQNNTYLLLNQENDGRPGAQTVAHFYAANIAGGPDTITVNWSGDNYKGVLAAEIAGVTGSPLVGHSGHIQDGGLTADSGNVSSEGMTVSAAAGSALLVALTMDTDGGGSDIGGSGFCAVPPGSGFTQVAQVWSWSAAGHAACNLATLETKSVTGSGSVAGVFNSTHMSDPYVTVAAMFR